MSFLQEKYSRRYFLGLLCLVIALFMVGAFLVWYCGTASQKLLFVREQSLTSSLIDQGVPADKIAVALKSNRITEEGNEFLQQIGHTTSVSFWLFPSVVDTARSFAVSSFVGVLCFSVLLLGTAVCFLQKREALYRTAAETILQFADGNFKNHLPKNESGTIFQLFSAIEELAMALQAQNEKEHHRKEFLKNTISEISHQLKTPLAALTMYVEIISEEPDQVKTVQEFSQKSMRSLERMEQLIQSLLKVTRLDAGSIVFDKNQQLVPELIERATENLTVRAQEEEKQIIIRGDAGETLFCDLEWTSEAIGNLIKNALDHTEKGGTIRIDWQRLSGMFRISVSDNGCGIAQEDIHHIFKRFYRSKNSNSHQGIGLGLPLAKAIVEGQNGMISVHSVYGEGTTFTISFLTDL